MYNDESLGIITRGVITDHCDYHHQFYQGTFWSVLERIIDGGYITKDSRVIDYGCGKGRAAFLFNHAIGCDVVGIEYAKPIYDMAMENLKRYGEDRGVSFVWGNAEEYVPVGADTFYFFNPFSLETLKAVVENIGKVDTAKRIIFYYLLYDIETYLRSVPFLKVVDEIDCQPLAGTKCPQNKIMVFDITQTIQTTE